MKCAAEGRDGRTDTSIADTTDPSPCRRLLDRDTARAVLANLKSFPSAEQLVESENFTDLLPLLPTAKSRGHRHRQRTQRKREIAIEANRLLRQLNSLDSGLRPERTMRRQSQLPSRSRSSEADASGLPTVAVRRLHSLVLLLAANAVRVRRADNFCRLSGAQVTANLIRADVADRYSFKTRSHNQVPMEPYLIDEPLPDWLVGMLSALPHRERCFYEKEANVVDLNGKSKVLFDELETRFGFVGGSYAAYVEYLNRKDMDPTLWHFVLQEEVQATAGLSTVSKKSGRQRKLLMQCATNYIFVPADTRSSLGMFGGGALSQVYVPGGEIAAAGFDESNAFLRL